MTRPQVAIRATIFILAALYALWLALLIVHESGHIIHAAISGARVERVLIPLLGFSRTDLAHNPHPAFVAWGGFIAGALIPGLLFVLARRSRIGPTLRAFAAVSLLANGAYACSTVGDAQDILRVAPRWPLLWFGTVAIIGGLLLLHRLDPRSILTPSRRSIGLAMTAAGLLALAAAGISSV